MDHPTIGMGVGEEEVGYLYGQYKRINIKSGSCGKAFLYGGEPGFHVRVRSCIMLTFLHFYFFYLFLTI